MADVETGGSGGAPDPTPETAPVKTVSLENFIAVRDAKTGLEAQVRDLRSQIASLTERASQVDALGAEVQSWKARAESESARFGAFVELSSAIGSTDPDVLAAFDQRYAALPEADRPDRKSWVEALRSAPDQAPALLRPWLSGGTGVPPTRPSPRVPGTPATPPGAPSSVSPEEIARVREEAVRTGDWSKWRDLSKAMGIRK